MGTPPSTNPRERYRQQIRAEVKELAWAQVAETGASAISLNAIAKRMGVSGPALYRYFASRDELITELIRDAYQDLADTLRAAAAAGTAPPELARAMRRWALDEPHRYLLIYGTPVPGYHAPADITAIAAGMMNTLLDTFASAAPGSSPAETALDAHLAAHRAWADGHQADPAVPARALRFWTRVHGVISLELAGHFAGMGFDPALLLAAEIEALDRRA